jgi:hypothetical protein
MEMVHKKTTTDGAKSSIETIAVKFLTKEVLPPQ